MNKFIINNQMVIPSYMLNTSNEDNSTNRKKQHEKNHLYSFERPTYHTREFRGSESDVRIYPLTSVPPYFQRANFSWSVNRFNGHPKNRQKQGESSTGPASDDSSDSSSHSPVLSRSQSCKSTVFDGNNKHRYYFRSEKGSCSNGGLVSQNGGKNHRARSRGHYPLPHGFLLTPYCTAPDRFLLRSHLMEVKETPPDLSENRLDKLSHSIWKKFMLYQQTEEIYKKKMTLWKFLYVYIKSNFPKYGLYLVGSTMSGFGGNCSDVDMCLLVRNTEIDQRNEALSFLTDILNLLNKFDFIEKPELIQAKVPILKFRDTNHGMQVDLNCNNSVGIRNTHLMYCYSQMDWRVKPLVIVVKLWAHWHDINDAKNMTISSYSLTLMVIHFLQYGVSPPVLPCLHNLYPGKFSPKIQINHIDIHEELDPHHAHNKMTLGQLLLHFLLYYTHFDYTNNAISVRTGSVLPVEDCRHAPSPRNDPHQWKYLCIEEPFDLSNTARSVYDAEAFSRIIQTFSRSASILKETQTLESLFKSINNFN